MEFFKQKFAGILVFALLSGVPAAWAGKPPSPTASQALAQFQKGEFRQASWTLENSLKEGSASAGSELLLARCYYELGEWNQSIKAAEAAIRLNPSDAESHLWLGRAYGREAEKERSLSLALKTRHEFEKAVSLAPSSVDARRDLMEFYLDAPWIVGGGKEKARKQAEAIAQIDPVEGALARARLDENAGNRAAASQEYARAIALTPALPGPYFEAARFYIAQNDLKGLNAAIEGAAKADPHDARLDYFRGVARVMAGQHLALAAKDLKSYAARSPRRDEPSKASALSWLGRLYERWGDAHLAMLEYQAALELDPAMPQVRQALERLKDN